MDKRLIVAVVEQGQHSLDAGLSLPIDGLTKEDAMECFEHFLDEYFEDIEEGINDDDITN